MPPWFGHRYVTLALLAVTIGLLPLFFPSTYYFRVASLVWVSAFAAIGLNILMGQAGQVSLGHAGFFGVGAYAVAIGPTHLGMPVWAAVLAGAVISAGLAHLVGRPILRLKGHYLAIATLGLGVLVALVITTESRWTGGPDGMSVARLTLFGWRVSGSSAWYWISGGLLVLGASERDTDRARFSSPSRQRGCRSCRRYRRQPLQTAGLRDCLGLRIDRRLCARNDEWL